MARMGSLFVVALAGATLVPQATVAQAGHDGMASHDLDYGQGVEPETLAKIVVDERYNAQKNPKAVFRGKPITVEAPLPEHMKHSWDTFGWTEDLAADDPFEELQ